MAATEATDPVPGEAPVGLVLVSHSAQLAEGAADLARAMAGEEVRIVAAGGMAPPETALGTDAVRVAAAIEEAWSERGVLVLMDLGSALLSAEMALELLPEGHRKRVLLSAAPLVEGAVAAAVASRLGEPIERVASEATSSLDAKRAQVGGPSEASAAPADEPGPVLPGVETRIAVDIPLGLHARPAARLIRATAGLNAQVLAGNATTGSAMVTARSLNALAGLQVREGHELLVTASGPDAQKAIDALRALAARRFDEPAVTRDGPPATAPAPPTARPLPPALPPTGLEGALRGVPASAGIAIGTLQFLEEADLTASDAEAGDPAKELQALELAVTAARRDLEQLRDQTRTRAGSYEAEIVDADLLFLEDPELLEPTRAAITDRRLTAARAWSEVSLRLGESWERLEDPTMRLRAADLAGVSRRVLHRLLGRPAPVLRRRGILVARDLAPTDTAALDPARVMGIATAGGGPTSHSAILARALGIPAVVGLGRALSWTAAGARSSSTRRPRWSGAPGRRRGRSSAGQPTLPLPPTSPR
jgi:phosphocarrier protein FPr